MSAELNIPSEVRSAGWGELRAAQSENAELVQAYGRVLHVVAPLIVAAELERLADDLTLTQQDMREEDNRTIRSSGLGTGIARLRDRAAELRGESR